MTNARWLWAVVLVTLLGSAGCSSTTPARPTATLVEVRRAPACALKSPATTSGLAPACGNFMGGSGSDGKLAVVLIGGLLLLSPVIIACLVVSAPFQLVLGRLRL